MARKELPTRPHNSVAQDNTGAAEQSESVGGGLKSSGSRKNGGLRACPRINFKPHPLDNQRIGYFGRNTCKILYPILVFRNSNHRLKETDNVTCRQTSPRKNFTNLPKFVSVCFHSLQTNKLPMSINDGVSVRSLCTTL